MSDIYTLFRHTIGDETTDYSMPDMGVLKLLDASLDKLAKVVGHKYIEDITVTSSDITAGYKDLTKDCLSIITTDLPYQNVYWQFTSPNRITFLDTDFITAGTYRFEYIYEYKKFNGALRDNSYFDYPRYADLGILYYALALYQRLNGIIKVDGSKLAVTSKSEEGMSESYSASESIELSSPDALERAAMKIWRDNNTSVSSVFSITI